VSLVVSDTSPLTNLAAIGQFLLLRQLYGSLHIAEAVWDELNAAGQHWPGRNEVAAAPWIQRHTPKNRLLVAALRQDLDAGEAESIALALERKADLILMDERDGRHKAMRLGEAGRGCGRPVDRQGARKAGRNPAVAGCLAPTSGVLSRRFGLPGSVEACR